MVLNAPLVQQPTQSGASDLYNGYFPVVAWLITIALFIVAARTKIGYTILFFFVIASILIVLAIGSPSIVKIFSFGAIVAPGQLQGQK